MMDVRVRMSSIGKKNENRGGHWVRCKHQQQESLRIRFYDFLWFRPLENVPNVQFYSFEKQTFIFKNYNIVKFVLDYSKTITYFGSFLHRE